MEPIQQMFEYLKTQRVCALAVEMLDGSPHVATVHFAHTDDPFTFIFETSRKYRKSEALLKNGFTRASVTVGFTEGETAKTVQIDGPLKEASEAQVKVYLEKFPEKAVKAALPETIFLQLDPTWWRFTDWDTPQGKTVYLSTDTSAT